MTDEFPLGTTVLSGGKTAIPKEVMEFLSLRYSARERQKLLWSQEGNDVVVKKGTLQSSFRKTILSRGEKTAVPKHIREALKLRTTSEGEGRILWIRRGDDVVVRRGTP